MKEKAFVPGSQDWSVGLFCKSRGECPGEFVRIRPVERLEFFGRAGRVEYPVFYKTFALDAGE